ncbi:hypothetical protein HDU67_005821 [Dinochytrium kinnereticum]|nr:hypothetical protein HDU67_005821 [Dinochytrium kinnereticum]
MAQVVTLSDPENIPSLDDAPESSIAEHATEGSLLFLQDLGGIRKELFFTDRVPLFSKSEEVRQQVGSSVVIVSEGIARGKSCYFVSVNTEAKLSTTSSVSSTITAYVGPDMQTISQSVYEVKTSSEGVVEHILEAVSDVNGRLVISESTTDKPDTCLSIPAKATRGLIMEGAEYVLFRIFSGHRLSQWFWYLSFTQGQVRKKSYAITPGCSRQSSIQTVENVIKINTSVDQFKTAARNLGAEDSDLRFNSSFDVSRDAAVSISDLVRQARAEDGFDDNLEDARCETYHLPNGHCIYTSRSNCEWYAELPLVPENHEAAPSNSLDSKNFGGNIELLSEFKQKMVPALLLKK